MTFSRCAAGLAALLTAMLLQATLIGPLLYPLPASLPLVLIAAVAVYNGPATGVSLGFAGGLVADLASAHPVGVLALVWLGVGLAAGVFGGMVMPVATPSTRPARGRPAVKAASRRREQALLIGVLGGLGAAASAVMLTLLGRGTDPLPTLLVRCVPGGLLDAILALGVLAVVAPALRAESLRARVPVRMTGAGAVHPVGQPVGEPADSPVGQPVGTAGR